MYEILHVGLLGRMISESYANSPVEIGAYAISLAEPYAQQKPGSGRRGQSNQMPAARTRPYPAGAIEKYEGRMEREQGVVGEDEEHDIIVMNFAAAKGLDFLRVPASVSSIPAVADHTLRAIRSKTKQNLLPSGEPMLDNADQS